MKTSTVLCAIVVLSLPSAAHAAKIYGVAVAGTTQSLVTWDSAAPGVILSTLPITGMPAGETIRGIDFDPFFAPGFQKLFGIGAGSDQFANVYRIQLQSGFAGKLPPSGAPPATAFGQNYGVDVPDSTTIWSVDDGAIRSGYLTSSNSGAADKTLIYAPQDVHAGETPHLVHYVDNLAVDTNLDTLVLVGTGGGNPMWVSTVAPLGIDLGDAGAIDVDVPTDTIYAALLPAGQTQSSFYTLNQQTGATTLIGPIGNGLLITAMPSNPH